MVKTYMDFLEAAAEATDDGHNVVEAVITEETSDGFFEDGTFTEEDAENQDALGDFSVPLNIGDEDYVLTESGERYHF